MFIIPSLWQTTPAENVFLGALGLLSPTTQTAGSSVETQLTLLGITKKADGKVGSWPLQSAWPFFQRLPFWNVFFPYACSAWRGEGGCKGLSGWFFHVCPFGRYNESLSCSFISCDLIGEEDQPATTEISIHIYFVGKLFSITIWTYPPVFIIRHYSYIDE